MKNKIVIFLYFIAHALVGQNTNYEKLIEAFTKRDYWSSYDYNRNDENVDSLDSLTKYNQRFKDLLLDYTSSYGQSITSSFKDLSEMGLIVSTSEDGLFRIYSWDTLDGGTMHNFEKVFQFKDHGKVISTVIDAPTEYDAGNYCTQINDITVEKKRYYLVQTIAVGSSAVTIHNIKIYSIDDAKINDDAKLIKTKSGIQNQLGYTVDLTMFPMAWEDIPDFTINYDKKKKIIILPLIKENGKITNKKIKYQFKGQYFQKK